MSDILYLQNALLLDAYGKVHDKHEVLKSNNFDEIRNWSDKIYMPYEVTAKRKFIRPNCSLHAINIGSMILSRFSYGIPVHLDDFGMDAGVGVVLTTLKGSAQHSINQYETVDTGVGDSFVVDNSHTNYYANFDSEHLQLNITFTHKYIASLYLKLTGCSAPQDLWQSKVKFNNSPSWVTLLRYIASMSALYQPEMEAGLLGKHLEETIGTNLLLQWANASGFDLNNAAHQVIPGSVIKAEKYIEENAIDIPTTTEIAAAAGVSVRSLQNGFKKYRNTTPNKYLMDKRLQGARAEILASGSNIAICEVAYAWGFLNLGRFSYLYRRKFGELPSETRSKVSFIVVKSN